MEAILIKKMTCFKFNSFRKADTTHKFISAMLPNKLF